ncbi:MAG: hypothetical protein COA43_11240 [Robiginitomaculum sp.]|nr:MAG: hypothetical protein COA43_11240 [Robiginitomaculum sp.]
MPKLYNVNVDGVMLQARSEEWLRAKYGDKADAIIFDAQQFERLVVVDKIHADLLNKLTGGASIEERDTWQAKELAARAVIAGTASSSQSLMIGTEAHFLGKTPAKIADTIIVKAKAFHKLIGLAGGIRSKSRIAIKSATTQAELDSAITTAQEDVAAGLDSFNAQ